MKGLVLTIVFASGATLFAQGQAGGTGTTMSPTQGGRAQGTAPAPVDVPWNDSLPAGTAAHAERALKESPRHGEWVDIKLPDGTALNSFVVYPQRPDKAGVVLVIHDINGMRDIPRAVGDQLAEDGFIAIVPDFLSGKGPNGGGTASLGTAVGQTIRMLTNDEMAIRLNAAMEYGKKIAASNGKTAVIGFCWGGTQSFNYAIAQPNLNAAVVYYGNPTGATADAAPEEAFAKIKAPVIGMYGGSDARINTTIPPTEAAMKKLGKWYEANIFEGAGHGFLRQQAGSANAPGNLKAAEQAWPLTVEFLKKHTK